MPFGGTGASKFDAIAHTIPRIVGDMDDCFPESTAPFLPWPKCKPTASEPGHLHAIPSPVANGESGSDRTAGNDPDGAGVHQSRHDAQITTAPAKRVLHAVRRP